MELFEARDHYIVQNGENALWCNRFDGSLVAKRGRFWGTIGKHRNALLSLFSTFPWGIRFSDFKINNPCACYSSADTPRWFSGSDGNITTIDIYVDLL